MSTIEPSTYERKRRRAARREPMDVTQIAPGMFEVANQAATASGDGPHTVDVREHVCSCKSYQFDAGPLGVSCKHLACIEQISEGVLCPECTGATCRPSCPERGEH